MLKRAEAKLYSILFLGLTIIFALLSIRAATPPPVAKSDVPDSVFSAERAFTYLQQIARAPHSVGTEEHDRVKNYIVNTCKQLGLTVEIQNTTKVETRPKLLVAINVHNIIAYKKGTKPGKAILNVAHYDSQPNTPGAADDGIGVAAMLETARAIKSLPPVQNDIMFLFSDGEEPGLLGAKAFVDESPLFKNVSVVMNWDFRGNSGIVVTYETSTANGWIMREYAKGAKYPYGNSMAFEISKRLPNFVDFKQFKKAGITGFTSGMIDGLTSYHSMTDNLENVDQRSLQQVGDNMLGMINQLGNRDLKNTKGPNVSYFNAFGYWFIFYPAFLNIFFAIITTLLFLAVLYIGFSRGQIKIPGFLISIIALPVTITITYFASSFILKRIIRHYPLYAHFDENNSYNSNWYFLSMTLLAIFFFSFIYQYIVKRWGQLSTFAGILLSGVVFMWMIYFFAPSATWLLFIPLLFLSAGYWWLLINQKNTIQNNLVYQIVSFISVLPVLLLFAPLTYLLFVSFGLGSSMPFVSILIVFITALTYPVLGNVLKNSRWLLPLVSIVGVIFLLLMANVNSGYNEKHPLQTNIRYQLNASDSTALWISDLKGTDKFTNKFFTGKKATSDQNKNQLSENAPVLPFTPPAVIVEKDTSYHGSRELILLCSPTRNNTNNMGIIIDDSTLLNVNNIEINNRRFESEPSNKFSLPNSIIFYGAPKPGFVIKFIMKTDAEIGMTLFDRSVGLPLIKDITAYPKDVIPGQGFNNNTTQVEKHFIF